MFSWNGSYRFHSFSSVIAIVLLSTSLLVSVTTTQASSISKASSTATRSDKKEIDFPLNQPDRLVGAAPLAVVAVCKDGVAFIALHTAAVHEPLLFDLEKENDSDDEPKSLLRDIPPGHRGALRILPLDGEGTTIVSVGWRSDCTILASKCRSLASDEREIYGTTLMNEGEKSQIKQIRSLSYGQYLARETSKWMAQCVFSDNVRGLSCVNLLSTAQGDLWLVDATGAYPVRAYALGQGSEFVNKRLSKIDFSNMAVEKGARKLLDIIQDEGFLDSRTQWKLLPNTAVEIALLMKNSRRIKRVKQDDLSI